MNILDVNNSPTSCRNYSDLTEHYVTHIKTKNFENSYIFWDSPQLSLKYARSAKFHSDVRGSVCNFFLTLSLLYCGDIHPDPGPSVRTPRCPCVVCGKGVVKKSKAIDCDLCQRWTHVRCSGSMSIHEYDNIVEHSLSFSYCCNPCLLKTLPYVPDLDSDEISDDNHHSGTDTPSDDQDHFQCFEKKGLHFVHINIRSMVNKMADLISLANKTRASVIAVSETWLDTSVTDGEIRINGYNVVRKDRGCKGGGVCLYIKDNLPFNCRTDLDQEGLEGVWVDIFLPKTKPITVGVVYRPPTQSNFLDLLQMTLSNIDPSREFYLLGDMNINMVKNNHNSVGLLKNYKQILNVFGLNQLIKEPTRVTNSSESVIDHIVTNQPDKICQNGTVHVGISDHALIYCTRKIVRGTFRGHNAVKIRSLKHYSRENLNSLLSSQNWAEVYESHTATKALEVFNCIMLSVIDSVAPVKEVRVKSNTEPWIDSSILEAIATRDSLLHKYLSNKSNLSMLSEYRKARNKVQELVKKAKSNYVSDKIEEDRNNPKNLWTHLKNLGHSNKNKGNSQIILEVDNEICYDSLTVGNHINNFFTGIASKLVDSLPTPSNIFRVGKEQFMRYYSDKGITPGAFRLKEVDSSVVHKHLESLKESKSTGFDNISGKFLKEGADHIYRPLSHIINLSIRTSEVPPIMKLAKVTPLHKKNSRLQVGNYRPVSILTITSKLLERCVYDQIESYLQNNHLVYEFQSGFRKGYSTDTCLIYLQDHIRQQMDQGLYTGVALLDVQKAFDCVDHEILCRKLEHLGIEASWFKSYLSDRKQTVSLGGVLSKTCDVSCGVPQGSLLGPLLFLIYSNDMKAAVNCKLLLYADDSVLMVSDKDPEVVSKLLGDEMLNCYNWMIDNRLAMHAGKTELILFASKRKLKKVQNFHVNFQNFKIYGQNSVKYLGVLLDNDLSGKSMVESTIKKAASRLKFLFRQGKYLNLKCRKLLGSALVQSHLDYCCSSWYYGLTKKLQGNLQIMQNKLVRFVLGLHPREHLSQTHLNSIGFVKISDRTMQLMLNHVFNIRKGLAPRYLSNFFTNTTEIHRHFTRHSQLSYNIPQIQSFTKGSFFYNAITGWNALPLQVKTIDSKQAFKTRVKRHLADRATFLEQSAIVF